MLSFLPSLTEWNCHAIMMVMEALVNLLDWLCNRFQLLADDSSTNKTKDPFAKCCPKRKARFFQCEKQRRCKPHGDCFVQRFCFKMVLPPPLPIHHRSKMDREQGPANTHDSGFESEESDHSSSTLSVVAPHHSTSWQQPQAHLMDLVRMQQWGTILALPRLKKREVKLRDADGLLPLHWAASGSPPLPVIQALLQTYPSSVRKGDSEQSLPLHFAAHYSASLDVVLALKQAHPQAVLHQDKYGRTPLYHAADKNAPLNVLQALAWDDPATITTPCHLPESASRNLSRERAIRTPLFLVWASVVSDRNARLSKQGKRWDKAIWMLTVAYQYRDDDTGTTNSTPSITTNILNAGVALDMFLPEPVVSLLVAKYPEHLKIPDRLGRLPLEVAVSTVSYALSRLQSVMDEILEADPQAMHRRNPVSGRSVLAQAALSGQPWAGVLDRLFRMAPQQIPVAYAASSVPIVYESDPTISFKALDPFNFLQKKENQKIQEDSVHASRADLPRTNHNKSDTVQTTHVNTVYQLLRMDPGQLVR